MGKNQKVTLGCGYI